ncbi:MAG: hypothetical protein R3Y33_00385 [Clostridia bacterium]
MDVFKNLGSAILQAKQSVSNKAQKNAIISKLTALIKKEKAISDRAYIALGKYYYNNERNVSNAQTEIICGEIEEALKKIEQAKAHLRKIYDSSEKETIIIEENMDYAVSDGMVDESIEKLSEDELPVE